MEKKLEDILNEALAPELKAQLQEAFDAKVEAMREQVQESVEAELANRYEHDKGQLVEAMDRMLTDVIRVHEEAKAAEITKLRESRTKFEANTKDVKTALRTRITKLRGQKIAVNEAAEKLATDVASVKKGLSENHARHLSKINEFITRQLTKELREFEQDKRDLVETRVKLVTENKQKLAEAQSKFVKEAAKKVEQTIGLSFTKTLSATVRIRSDAASSRPSRQSSRLPTSQKAPRCASFRRCSKASRKKSKQRRRKPMLLSLSLLRRRSPPSMQSVRLLLRSRVQSAPRS
jgi:hypothetical protein